MIIVSYYSEPLPEILSQESSLDHEHKRFGCFLLIKGCLLVVILILIMSKIYGQRIYINGLNRIETGQVHFQQAREKLNSYLEKTRLNLTQFGIVRPDIQ